MTGAPIGFHSAVDVEIVVGAEDQPVGLTQAVTVLGDEGVHERPGALIVAQHAVGVEAVHQQVAAGAEPILQPFDGRQPGHATAASRDRTPGGRERLDSVRLHRCLSVKMKRP